MDLSDYARDEEAVEEGRWFDAGDEAQLKIRYWKNEDFVNYIRKVTDNSKNLPDHVQDSVSESAVRKGVARHILVDWKNVKLNGEELEYNEDNVVEVLKEFPEFSEMVIGLSQDFSNFKAEQQEVDVENLSNT